jgi:uncharacterized protein
MGDELVQRLIADACLRGLGDEDLAARAARFGVTGDDLAALAATPGRLRIYRRLVRTNLLGVTSRMMPRTRARLNATTDGAFEASFDAFLAEAAPTTHYLRDVPAEYLAWAGPRWEASVTVPRYLADLARHELVHFQIAVAPPLTKPSAIAELSLERRLVFTPARRLEHYSYAVHALPDELDDRTEPARRPVSLLVYRDEDHSVRLLELTPLAALIAEQLFADKPLGEAVAIAAAAHGTPLTPDVLSSTASMLADWGERGILLGAEA